MEHMQHIPLQDKDHWNNMLVWCNENFGEIKVNWAAINYGNASATFIFRKQEDHAAFVSAWVG